MSVHGDRVGVLQVTAPATVLEKRLDQLTDLATLTGYALTATSRHTDLLHRAARSRRMTLAAELQWQLLPVRGCLAPEYELAGHLEPAYAVYADNFDWSEDEGHLLVSITDAANHARSTPLLTTLSVTAARNARRDCLGIAEQAAMADQAVYTHQGDHSVDAIFMTIDIATGRASALKAGSPAVVLLREGALHPIGLTDQIPLGMFEGTEYTEQSFQLATGDRLLLMSDGFTDGWSPRGGSLPHQRLLEILERDVDEHPAGVVRSLIDELIAHHGGNDLDDDATVVCLDWNGPGCPNELTLTEPDIVVREARPHLHAVAPAQGLRITAGVR